MRDALLHGLLLTFVFVVPAAGVLGALLTLAIGRVTTMHAALFLVGFFTTGFGITVGYHRLAAHRSFETHPALKALLLILGAMAAEGPVVEWVANHLKHHAEADRDQDPHSPSHGFWHAHCGWLLHQATFETEKYAPTLLRDPVAVSVSRTFPIWVTAGYVIPFLIAGWEGLIWGGLFRQFAVQNVTFAVNSVCHRFGSRPFATGDLSTNNWIVGLLGLGEGWHNNHHAFPSSALHGLRRWEIDLSGRLILSLETLRLAWNVKRPSLDQIERRLAEAPKLAATAQLENTASK